MTLTLGICSCVSRVAVPRFAEGGVLDLTDWDFRRDGTVVLRGEALFYWSRLLTPSTIDKAHPSEAEIIQASSNWNYASDHPARGYGTYRMSVLLPRRGMDLGLYLANQDTSYSLWLNGDLVSANGVVSADPGQAVPQYLRRIVFYHAVPASLDLVLQVSNHHIRCGGWGNGIEIGSPSVAEADSLRTLFTAVAPALCFCLLAVYHLLNFLLRPKESAHLYYALFLLFVSTWTVFAGEYVFYRVFPAFPWPVGFRIQYIAGDLFLLSFFLYFGELFPREFPRTALRVLAAFTAVLVVVKTLVPIYTLSVYLTVFTHVYPIGIGAVGCALLILAAIRRRENSILILAGLVVLLLLWIYDTLAINQIIARSTGSLLHYGFFGFVLLHTVVLARRFALAYGRYDYLTHNLEREVDKRTEELTLSKATLEEADRSRTDFFLHLSHEVRTPLTLVINALDAYAAEHPGDGRLASIKRNLDLLLKEISEFFDLVRIDKGIHVYTHDVKMDLTRFVRRKLDLYRSDANSRGIEIAASLQEGLVLKADPVAVDRILNNLVANAVKYNRPGGSITVTLTGCAGRIVLEVADTGVGVPPAERESLFLPYHRGAGSAASVNGLGVGLAVVQGIVDTLGGNVAHRENPGGGSIFTVILPHDPLALEALPWAATEMEQPVNAPPPDIGPVRTDGQTLLVVEDNIELSSLVRARLRRDYVVHVASDGRAALDLLERIPKPDLIVSDVMMEGMDGFALLEAIKEHDTWRDIPFLFLTAVTLNERKKTAYGMGALDYIAKPFRIDELESKIRSILDHQTLRREIEERRRFASLGVLMSAFAHEVFNPLSGITGPLEVIRKRLADEGSHELRKHLAYIDENVLRIERIVHTLRDIHADRPLALRALPLRDAVEHALPADRATAPDRVCVDNRVPPDVLLRGNEFALEQILRNVVTNAVESMPKGGTVRFEYRKTQSGEHGILSVHDTGAGAPDDDRLFEPFHTHKSGGHMGMGLYVVRMLCDRLHWSCTLRTAPEGGAVFALEIPLGGKET